MTKRRPVILLLAAVTILHTWYTVWSMNMLGFLAFLSALYNWKKIEQRVNQAKLYSFRNESIWKLAICFPDHMLKLLQPISPVDNSI
jgi:hypothetical protein